VAGAALARGWLLRGLPELLQAIEAHTATVPLTTARRVAQDRALDSHEERCCVLMDLAHAIATVAGSLAIIDETALAELKPPRKLEQAELMLPHMLSELHQPQNLYQALVAARWLLRALFHKNPLQATPESEAWMESDDASSNLQLFIAFGSSKPTSKPYRGQSFMSKLQELLAASPRLEGVTSAERSALHLLERMLAVPRAVFHASAAALEAARGLSAVRANLPAFLAAVAMTCKLGLAAHGKVASGISDGDFVPDAHACGVAAKDVTSAAAEIAATCERALGEHIHDIARTGHCILAWAGNPSRDGFVTLLARAVHALVGCVAAIARARALPWKEAPPSFSAANLELVGPCSAFSPHTGTGDARVAAEPGTARSPTARADDPGEAPLPCAPVPLSYSSMLASLAGCLYATGACNRVDPKKSPQPQASWCWGKNTTRLLDSSEGEVTERDLLQLLQPSVTGEIVPGSRSDALRAIAIAKRYSPLPCGEPASVPALANGGVLPSVGPHLPPPAKRARHETGDGVPGTPEAFGASADGTVRPSSGSAAPPPQLMHVHAAASVPSAHTHHMTPESREKPATASGSTASVSGHAASRMPPATNTTILAADAALAADGALAAAPATAATFPGGAVNAGPAVHPVTLIPDTYAGASSLAASTGLLAVPTNPLTIPLAGSDDAASMSAMGPTLPTRDWGSAKRWVLGPEPRPSPNTAEYLPPETRSARAARAAAAAGAATSAAASTAVSAASSTSACSAFTSTAATPFAAAASAPAMGLPPAAQPQAPQGPEMEWEAARTAVERHAPAKAAALLSSPLLWEDDDGSTASAEALGEW